MSNQSNFSPRFSSERSSINTFLILQIILLIPLILTLTNSKVYSELPSTSTDITDTDEIFTTYINDLPQVDLNNWTFKISGLIENPIFLNYSEILAMPQTTMNATLRCVDGFRSYAMWKGVPLSDIFDLVILEDTATDIIFMGMDDYNSSFELNNINASEILIVTHVNNETLPAELGYPLRIVAPGHYGYKWVMFLYEMRVVDYDHLGYWESRGWLDDATYTEVGPKIWTNWALHSILLSLTFFIGSMAWMGGMKKYFEKTGFIIYPKRFTRKIHLILGILYCLLTLGISGGWIIQRVILRGNLDWEIHGIFAVSSGILLLGIIPTSYLRWKNQEKIPKFRWHLVFTSLSLIAMTIAIISGLILIYRTTIFPFFFKLYFF